jgi:serine/threonine protein kinase
VKKPTPFGKYYLLERINVGGMAEVFRAKAFGVEGFERLVAVKRILPNIAEDKEFIRMFIDEAKLAVQLNHANIAQIFDLGVVDNSYFIALEHVHGRDLRAMFDRCRQLGEPMPTSQACFIVMKVCEGLDYAHNKRDQSGRELQLVHRDVSPQNVLVSFEGEVKIIDFGIAKAAGKGSKTQAGILKGKFGYMSPEQVRGIPIDRRSDVFSCGIVLYELLTGERLFVGESDFSTLEKVRNVEILPPSTYNRRIPDELERIVLKALAKDPDERYANAIDLHDELQAFVYTAGEFYSRKDLAGWMKKTFGREIEEESAKLESYRQLKPPPEMAPAGSGPVVSRTGTGSRPATTSSPVRKATQSMTRPPPPPPTAGVRVSQQLPTAPIGKKARRDETGDLSWDDDELETQIYDNPEDDPRRGGSGKQPVLPLVAQPTPAPELYAQPVGSPHPGPPPLAPPAAPTIQLQPSPATTLTGHAPAPGAAPGPDLSSLVSTGRDWGAPGGPPIGTNGSNGAAMPMPGTPPRPQPAFGSTAMPVAQPMPARDRSNSVPFVHADPMFSNDMPAFGSGVLGQKRKSSALYLAVGGAALAVIAVVVIIAATSGGSKKPVTPEPPGPGSGSAPAPPVAQADPNTGFDLYVTPPGTMTWRLDGESRKDRLPSRIRGIAPGVHQVAIDAPSGFLSQNQAVTVEAGKASKVEIVLTPLSITGDFESNPTGANVTLIVDGTRQSLGASPAKSTLDPRKTYQVLFEKPGFVSANRPIVFSGQTEEKIAVDLEKAGAAVAPTPTPPQTPPETHPVVHAPVGPVTRPEHPEHPEHPVTVAHNPDVTPKPPEAKGQGFLTIGSKPPCEIYVDGSDSGFSTPKQKLVLESGRHRITLVNNDFNIKETFSVDIQADQVTKQIKDYSDRIQPQ